MNIDKTSVTKVAIAPDMIEKMFAAENTSRVLCEFT